MKYICLIWLFISSQLSACKTNDDIESEGESAYDYLNQFDCERVTHDYVGKLCDLDKFSIDDGYYKPRKDIAKMRTRFKLFTRENKEDALNIVFEPNCGRSLVSFFYENLNLNSENSY